MQSGSHKIKCENSKPALLWQMFSAGYRKRVPPVQTTSVRVKLSMYVFWIRLSEVSMDYTMQVYFRTTWRDHRLQVQSSFWSEQQNQNLVQRVYVRNACVWFVSSQFQPLPEGKTEMRLTVAEAQRYLWFPDTFIRWVNNTNLLKILAWVQHQTSSCLGRQRPGRSKVLKIEVFLWCRNRISEDTLDPLKMTEVNSLITLNSTGHVRVVRRLTLKLECAMDLTVSLQHMFRQVL